MFNFSGYHQKRNGINCCLTSTVLLMNNMLVQHLLYYFDNEIKTT